MHVTRRALGLGGLGVMAGMSAGCVALGGPLTVVGDAGLVHPFSMDRQVRLFTLPVPFLAIFRRGRFTLGFAAAQHSVDPEGATFRLITAAFAEVAPRAVILEGFPSSWGPTPRQIVSLVPERNKPDADSYTRGEAVHAASIALASGIPFTGGEPTDRELNAALAGAGFAPEDIFFCDMIKVLDQDRSAGMFASVEDPLFAEAYARWAQSLSRSSGYADPGIERFRVWYLDTFKTPLASDPDWANRTDPGKTGLGADISRAQGLLRDRHLHDLAIRQLNEHRTILIVYGASHLANLWDAFHTALASPRLKS